MARARRAGSIHQVGPLTGFAVILYVLYGMDRTAKILGGRWIGAGILYYLVLAARTRGRASTVSFPPA